MKKEKPFFVNYYFSKALSAVTELKQRNKKLLILQVVRFKVDTVK